MRELHNYPYRLFSLVRPGQFFNIIQMKAGFIILEGIGFHRFWVVHESWQAASIDRTLLLIWIINQKWNDIAKCRFSSPDVILYFCWYCSSKSFIRTMQKKRRIAPLSYMPASVLSRIYYPTMASSLFLF
jgi:hypothetical protein